MYNNNMLLSIIMLIYFRDTGQPSLLFQDNHVDWAPSLHLGHEAVPKTSVEKYDRALRRDNTKRQSQSCHTEIEAAKRRKGVKQQERQLRSPPQIVFLKRQERTQLRPPSQIVFLTRQERTQMRQLRPPPQIVSPKQ